MARHLGYEKSEGGPNDIYRNAVPVEHRPYGAQQPAICNLETL